MRVTGYEESWSEDIPRTPKDFRISALTLPSILRNVLYRLLDIYMTSQGRRAPRHKCIDVITRVKSSCCYRRGGETRKERDREAIDETYPTGTIAFLQIITSKAFKTDFKTVAEQ
jgi:hypothetical protein